MARLKPRPEMAEEMAREVAEQRAAWRFLRAWQAMTLACVLDDPADKMQRLVLADWMEEKFDQCPDVERRVWMLRQSVTRPSEVSVDIYSRNEASVRIIFTTPLKQEELPAELFPPPWGIPATSVTLAERIVPRKLPPAVQAVLPVEQTRWLETVTFRQGGWVYGSVECG